MKSISSSRSAEGCETQVRFDFPCIQHSKFVRSRYLTKLIGPIENLQAEMAAIFDAHLIHKVATYAVARQMGG